MGRAFLTALLATVLVFPALAEAPKSCALVLRATMPVTMDATGRITVPVTFNGVAKELMIDTGTPVSMLTAETALDLKLRPRPAPNGVKFVGFGGGLITKAVTIDEFGIGGMKGKDFSFFVDPDPMEAAGLLGVDFMYYFDLDFDFAHAKLNLMLPDHCPGKVVYWTRQPFGVVPFELNEGHIQVKVQLDGKDVWAILDTGAVDTVMSLERTARVFDRDSDELKKKRRHPFKTLSFDEVTINNPAVTLIPDNESVLLSERRMSMIIGMTVLRRLHLYISYKEKMIYVTPATQY